jgi:hypothetical protein
MMKNQITFAIVTVAIAAVIAGLSPIVLGNGIQTAFAQGASQGAPYNGPFGASPDAPYGGSPFGDHPGASTGAPYSGPFGASPGAPYGGPP